MMKWERPIPYYQCGIIGGCGRSGQWTGRRENRSENTPMQAASMSRSEQKGMPEFARIEGGNDGVCMEVWMSRVFKNKVESGRSNLIPKRIDQGRRTGRFKYICSPDWKTGRRERDRQRETGREREGERRRSSRMAASRMKKARTSGAGLDCARAA